MPSHSAQRLVPARQDTHPGSRCPPRGSGSLPQHGVVCPALHQAPAVCERQSQATSSMSGVDLDLSTEETGWVCAWVSVGLGTTASPLSSLGLIPPDTRPSAHRWYFLCVKHHSTSILKNPKGQELVCVTQAVTSAQEGRRTPSLRLQQSHSGRLWASCSPAPCFCSGWPGLGLDKAARRGSSTGHPQAGQRGLSFWWSPEWQVASSQAGAEPECMVPGPPGLPPHRLQEASREPVPTALRSGS